MDTHELYQPLHLCSLAQLIAIKQTRKHKTPKDIYQVLILFRFSLRNVWTCSLYWFPSLYSAHKHIFKVCGSWHTYLSCWYWETPIYNLLWISRSSGKSFVDLCSFHCPHTCWGGAVLTSVEEYVQIHYFTTGCRTLSFKSLFSNFLENSCYRLIFPSVFQIWQ